MSFALSRWWSPIDGSSRMYRTPISVVPIWVASRIRWASPPDSVDARPVEGQVVEPDVDEEAEARADLLEQLVGDRPLALVERRLEAARPGRARR